jgi:hypothetical protein
MAGNFFTEMMLGYQRMNAISEVERKSIHRMFAAFYNNDYLLINDILKRHTLNNPFSEETLNKINFQHLDVTTKIINRITSGIYSNQPLRELLTAGDKQDENLQPLLNQIRYNAKVKDAFRKATYFNLVVVHPVWDYQANKLRLDVITPENIEVETKDDYLQIERIKVCRARPDGTIYFSVWSDTEHYIIDGDNKTAPPNNEDGINPFGKIPFVILRINDGLDFYGEPNWNVFLHQKNFDIRYTDLNESELRTVMGIWHGINTKFDKGTVFSAGQLLQSYSTEGEPVSLESITQNIDYVSVRENIDWKNKLVMMSEGLSSQSGNTEVSNESGVKRAMDEIELQEKRNDFKEILYNFEIELLNMIRLVNNTYNPVKLNDKAIFEVTFSEEKETENISDKIARRQMEKEIGYYDEIDFTMQDLEVDYNDAVQVLQERKKRMTELGLQENEVNNPGGEMQNDNDA